VQREVDWRDDKRLLEAAELKVTSVCIEDARTLLGHDEQITTRIYTSRRRIITVLPTRGKG